MSDQEDRLRTDLRNQTASFGPARKPGPKKKELRLNAEALVRGIIATGTPGSGKTVLLVMLLYTLLLRHQSVLVIDAKGVLTRLLFKLVLRLPEPMRSGLLARLRYWPVGHSVYTYTLPFYHAPGSHDQRAQRFLDTIMKLSPTLADRPIMGKPSVYSVGMPVGMILSALGYQITEAIDLFANVGTKGSIWGQKLAEAERVVPEAVHLFRKTYLQWSDAVRRDRRYAFESHIVPYYLSDTLRALVGGSSSLDFSAIEQQGLILLVDTSKLDEDLVRDQFTIQLFTTFLDYIKRRGVGDVTPWSLILEEAAVLMQTEALLDDIQSLANQFRNHRLQPIISFQSTDQLSEKMSHLLYAFGTHIIGTTSSPQESDRQADFLLTYDPYLIKFPGRPIHSRFAPTTYTNPDTFTVDEQRRMLADQLKHQRGREFYVRRYLNESTVDPHIHHIHTTLTLPDLSCVTEAAVQQAQEENVAAYAQEVAAILREIDARLPRRAPSPQAPTAQGSVEPKQLR